jgi:hypothetical protein
LNGEASLSSLIVHFDLVQTLIRLTQLNESLDERPGATGSLVSLLRWTAREMEGQVTVVRAGGQLYFALIENRSFLTSKNSGSQFNRSIGKNVA